MNSKINFDKLEKQAKIRSVAGKTVVYLLLGIWALFVLFPFYWMILTSVKSYGSYNAEFIPKCLHCRLHSIIT